jgi:hypothetical protein
MPRTPTSAHYIYALLQNGNNNSIQVDSEAAAPADELASWHDALDVANLFTTPPWLVVQPPSPQRALAPTPAPRNTGDALSTCHQYGAVRVSPPNVWRLNCNERNVNFVASLGFGMVSLN